MLRFRHNISGLSFQLTIGLLFYFNMATKNPDVRGYYRFLYVFMSKHLLRVNTVGDLYPVRTTLLRCPPKGKS